MRKKLRRFIDREGGRGRYGGIPCQTCLLDNVSKVNADIRAFHEAGGNASWNLFHQEILVHDWEYPFTAASARKHARACLDLT